MQEQGQPFIEIPWPLCGKGGIYIHSPIGLLSASAPPHLVYRSGAPHQYVSSLCLSLPLPEIRCSPQQVPHSSGALLIPSQACQKPPSQWTRDGQGNIFLICPSPERCSVWRKRTRAMVLQESTMKIFFPNSRDVGSLKFARVGVFAPWKSIN